MKRVKSHELKTFVYRVLIWRLLLASIGIAVVLGLVTFSTRYNDIGAEVAQGAINGLEQLTVQIDDILDENPEMDLITATGLAFNTEPRYRLQHRHGHFVLARFYDGTGKTMLQWLRPEQANGPVVQRFIDNEKNRFPVIDTFWHEKIQFGEHHYVQLVMAFTDRTGSPVFVQALFQLSLETVEKVRINTLKTVGYVMLIVLATAGLLYPVIIRLMRRLARISEVLLESHLDTIQVLGGAIAKRDSDTDAHNYRVTLYSAYLGESAGLSTRQMRALLKGAFLHDTGKIGIRDNILLKPGRLDEEEFKVMRSHVEHGMDIVNQSGWLNDALDVVGNHHEKYDGSGYPNGVVGEKIPVTARIFAIADVFDALTSRRPYKDPLSFDDTMSILEAGRGSHFDPRLLDLFILRAETYYERYGGREDENLKNELRDVVNRYFSGGVEKLVF